MIQIAYYLLTLTLLVIVILMFNKYTDDRKWIGPFLIVFALWIGYLSILDSSGVMTVLELPPRIPLLVVLPAIISLVIINTRKRFGQLIAKMPASNFIYIQSFRIVVEGIIFIMVMNKLVPQRVTVEGLNFDIIPGLTAPLVGYLLYKNVISNKVAIAWNVISLMILGVTVYAFISYLYFMEKEPFFNINNIANLAFLLLPGCLVPLAVFFHIVSIRRLRMT